MFAETNEKLLQITKPVCSCNIRVGPNVVISATQSWSTPFNAS